MKDTEQTSFDFSIPSDGSFGSNIISNNLTNNTKNTPRVSIKKSKNLEADFEYKNKFKSAIYVFILFIILSNKVAYKILDLIIKVFSNKIEIIDECETPLFLGILIMAFLFAIIIFLF